MNVVILDCLLAFIIIVCLIIYIGLVIHSCSYFSKIVSLEKYYNRKIEYMSKTELLHKIKVKNEISFKVTKEILLYFYLNYKEIAYIVVDINDRE